MGKHINVRDDNEIQGNIHKGDSWNKSKRYKVIDVASKHIIIGKTFKNGQPKKGTMKIVEPIGKK